MTVDFVFVVVFVVPPRQWGVNDEEIMDDAPTVFLSLKGESNFCLLSLFLADDISLFMLSIFPRDETGFRFWHLS